MREISYNHITGGELKLDGSSLRQSTLCFLHTLTAVITCQQNVSAQCASQDNVTSLMKKASKAKSEVIFVNETD